jgi:hypothetical protein
MLKLEDAETLKLEGGTAYLPKRLVLLDMLAKMATSSPVSWWSLRIGSPGIPQSSISSSIHNWDSSASCKAPSILEQNSAPERAKPL